MTERSLEAGSSVESCAHRFSFSNCCETLNAEFPGTFSLFGNVNFKEINLGIKMQRRLGKAFTFTFSQVLTVFWPGSAFPKSYLLLGVALLFVEWEGWGVGRCFTPLNVVDSMWFSFPGGPWGRCSDSWVHPRATGSKLSLSESLIYKIILLQSFSPGMKISLIRLNTGHWPMVFMIFPWILSLNNLTEWGFYLRGK